MKRLLAMLVVGLFLLGSGGVVWAADVGTLTLNSDTRMKIPGGSRAVRVIEWDWLSDGSGDCSEAANLVHNVTGTVIGLHAIPEGDTDDIYDVTVTDANGVDVLNGAGSNLRQGATSAENYRFPADFLNTGPIFIVDQTLTLVVAAGGSAKGEVIRLYILLP